MYRFATDSSNMLTVFLTDIDADSRLTGDSVSTAVWGGLLRAAWQSLCVKKLMHSAPWVGWGQASNVSTFFDCLAAVSKQAKSWLGREKKKYWDLANKRFLRLEENQRKDAEGHTYRPPGCWSKQLLHFLFCLRKDSVLCHCYSLFPDSL